MERIRIEVSFDAPDGTLKRMEDVGADDEDMLHEAFNAVNHPQSNCIVSTAVDDEGGLDAEALREIAHKEYEIAKLLGPDDDAAQAWLDYVEALVTLTDEYLKQSATL